MGKSIAFILYIFGLITAVTIAVIGFWPEFEATLFDSSISSDKSLNTLSCPMVITPSDNATVSATFTNPVDKPSQFIVKTHISQKYFTLLREFNQMVELDVAETKKVEWEISVDDAVYEQFVFARVRSLRSSGIPSRERACGILVLDVPGLTGNQIVTLLFSASLFGLIVGSVLWWQQARPLEGRDRKIALWGGLLTLLIMSSSVMSLLGFWAVSIVLLAVVILLGIGIFEHYFA